MTLSLYSFENISFSVARLLLVGITILRTIQLRELYEHIHIYLNQLVPARKARMRRRVPIGPESPELIAALD
jgi:hypothetical protein